MNKKYLFSGIIAMLSSTAMAQTMAAGVNESDSIGPYNEQNLGTVEIVRRQVGTKRMKGAINGAELGREELFKAACCNLGESFVTNPSVDVNYNDATTGARQIKLLGLSGTYVQMLTENLPNFRGASAPFALGYVPGPWMKSIQVSKGSSSVRNGYESITGQINVEYLKPEDTPGVTVNLYGDTDSRFEANADASINLGKGWSTGLLTHYENRWGKHDKNDDGFMDMPNVKQYNLKNTWKYSDNHYIFHGGISLLKEDRKSGQTNHSNAITGTPFNINIETDRYEGYMKHAFILNHEHNSSVALMASASMHEQDAGYGLKSYYVNEKNVYSQLLFESDITKMHNIALGLSLNYDYFGQNYRTINDAATSLTRQNDRETVAGAYAQYTFNLHHKLTAMAGLRVDNSSQYGNFVTPRLHVKWQPNDIIGIRASAGKGYRAVHALAENNYLLASGRQLIIDELDQEEAWNYGISAGLNIPLFDETLKLNAEYYYTDFSHQAVVDYDTDPRVIHIGNLNGKSYSHTFQVDATYPVFRGMTLTAAYRRNIVKATYNGVLMDKPLTGKYKGLLTASYKTPLGLWQFDATFQLNGGGRMPTPYTLADGSDSWAPRYNAFGQLSGQVTRWFRHFSVYVGGENLTSYRQKNPIIGYDNPWNSEFEPTMVWGPVSGAMVYAGVRINIGGRN